MRAHRGDLRGFTLVEVMFATLLLTLVGVAATTFLSATASGGEARRHMSDPALESALTTRRFKNLAPDFRHVLRVTEADALVWLSDLVPSQSVHTSEAALIRFDEAGGVLLLERVDGAFLDLNRQLEREFLADQYARLAELFESLRAAGGLQTLVIAEGIETVSFATAADMPSGLSITFGVSHYETTFLLTPAPPREPIG